MKSAAVILVLLSEEYFNSDACRAEFSEAIAQVPSDKVNPVHIEDSLSHCLHSHPAPFSDSASSILSLQPLLLSPPPFNLLVTAYILLANQLLRITLFRCLSIVCQFGSFAALRVLVL